MKLHSSNNALDFAKILFSSSSRAPVAQPKPAATVRAANNRPSMAVPNMMNTAK